MLVSCSLGAFFNPVTILCKRLTLWVAEATGVMTVSFSRKYPLPVSGVEGANDLFCKKRKICKAKKLSFLLLYL